MVTDYRSYVLHISIHRPTRLSIGKLGLHTLPIGHYYYVGSAKKGLEKRVQRHLNRKKRIFWHIDYLLSKTTIANVFVSTLSEIVLVKVMSLLCTIPIPKFGATDTGLPAHLFYSRTRIEYGILPYTILTQYRGTL